MKSSEIYLAIEEIAATSSKNVKQSLVTQCCDKSSDFISVLKYAYDPFKTYGIVQMPVFAADGSNLDFDEKTWRFLDGLIERSITGDLARIALKQHLERLNPASAELLRRIIRKDLRAGFSASTCNKAVKGMIPVTPYMRCSLPKDADLESWKGYISQEKADGMFGNLNFDRSGYVEITSRQGSPFPMDHLSDIVDSARMHLMRNTQTHGELLVYRDGVCLDRAESNGVMNSILKGGEPAANEKIVFVAWDQIPLDLAVPKGRVKIPYGKRLLSLGEQLANSKGSAVTLIKTKVFKRLKDAYQHAAELMKAGKEGSVVKNPDGEWYDSGSSGSKDQVKLKLEFDCDLKVIEVVPGREGTKNEGRPGSLTCVTSDGQLRVDVAVKNEKMRDEVEANPDDWIGRVIPVISNDILEPSDSNPIHTLFLPRMAEACYRTDKEDADTLVRVIAQKEAAINGRQLVEEAA